MSTISQQQTSGSFLRRFQSLLHVYLFNFSDYSGEFLPCSSRIKEEMTLSHSAFLLSSKTRTRSKRLSRGLASATLTDRGSLGSYWPFGLVAARMVVLVFSLQTILWTEEEEEEFIVQFGLL